MRHANTTCRSRGRHEISSRRQCRGPAHGRRMARRALYCVPTPHGRRLERFIFSVLLRAFIDDFFHRLRRDRDMQQIESGTARETEIAICRLPRLRGTSLAFSTPHRCKLIVDIIGRLEVASLVIPWATPGNHRSSDGSGRSWAGPSLNESRFGGSQPARHRRGTCSIGFFAEFGAGSIHFHLHPSLEHPFRNEFAIDQRFRTCGSDGATTLVDGAWSSAE